MRDFDRVGYWTEIKLDIIREYAKAYSTILSAQEDPRLTHVYIDAFAGPGIHRSKTSGRFIPGSPLNALLVDPPFKEFYFIDLDEQKVESLETLADERPGVHVFHGDCNEILLQAVFPNVLYQRFRRGLCLLDPYGLHLDWEVIKRAGQMQSIDLFLNFPTADMNRNVLRRDLAAVSSSQRDRLSRYWGDETWREHAYTTERTLFGDEQVKTGTQRLVETFRQRLRDIAGFAYVPEPMPMRNTKRAIVYHLFFAAQKPVADKIVREIFDKYGGRMR